MIKHCEYNCIYLNTCWDFWNIVFILPSINQDSIYIYHSSWYRSVVIHTSENPSRQHIHISQLMISVSSNSYFKEFIKTAYTVFILPSINRDSISIYHSSWYRSVVIHISKNPSRKHIHISQLMISVSSYSYFQESIKTAYTYITVHVLGQWLFILPRIHQDSIYIYHS